MTVLDATRSVLRASVDSFHNPARRRYARGRDSQEGYFLDSYDYESLRALVLEPFAAGVDVVPGVFDHRADRPNRLPTLTPADDAVLVFDGIFLHRSELVVCWDVSVFLDVDFAVSIPRGAQRGYGDPDPAAASNHRYVEGQLLYLAECQPRSRASTSLTTPILTARRWRGQRH